ncbi:MAG: SDR family oxidoreductase [Gemmatimonadetes bacterium]|nr:SDR family oxidoreductase [Gemmatimonadota bacterium]
MRVLVLGASGLLGNTVFRVLGANPELHVRGTVRDPGVGKFFPRGLAERLVMCRDLEDQAELDRVLEYVKPGVVINCLSASSKDIKEGNAARLNPVLAVLPQRLSAACGRYSARLIHISSDGVFSGSRGGYSEADQPDAADAYGIAKFQGEVDAPHAITIRTSMIGHELGSAHGLLEWFLAQEGECRCFTRAIFSGLPTMELARIIRDFVMPRPELTGVYHVAAQPISKCELLRLVAGAYGKAITLKPDERVVIDRSLSTDRFRAATGYVAPAWPDLIRSMHEDHVSKGS